MLNQLTRAIGYSALVAAGVGAAGHSYAQNDFIEGLHPYVGASYGFYKSGEGDYDEDRDLWEIYGGLALHRYFGVEVNYADLGGIGNDAVDINTDGWGLAGVAQLPIGETFSIYGKLGQLWYNTDVHVDLEDGEFDSSSDGEDPFYTIGAGFNVTDPLTITLEYTRYTADIDVGDFEGLNEATEDSDPGDLDTAKIGVRFMF